MEINIILFIFIFFNFINCFFLQRSFVALKEENQFLGEALKKLHDFHVERSDTKIYDE